MKFRFKNDRTVKYFLEGGAMLAPDQGVPQEAPQEEPMQEVGPEEPQGEPQLDPIMLLALMAAQALQTQDCQMAMQVCNVFVLMIQLQGAPAPEELGQPVYRLGGTLVARIRK